ncbi:MAG: HslU--HslV peptidase proteolytic subunit, partial [Mogibacterium diversum]|nr:HslU--HslV peptidase proteolytic subunit [Mogibacterium diversum]
MMVQFHATTICAVKRPDGDICIGGDGQVTMGETTIMKNGAKKV